MELNNQVVTLEKEVDEKTLEQNENSMIVYATQRRFSE